MDELLQFLTPENIELLAWIVGAFAIGALFLVGILWVTKYVGMLF
jgi:hypothetical protein